MLRSTFVLASLVLTASAAADTPVTFDGGDDGGFTGNAAFEAGGGNPGGNAHHLGTFFFNELRTGGLGEPANDAFLGDYSPYSDIEISFDVIVNSLTDFIGNQIARPIGIALIDRDIQGPSGPSGVFLELGAISSSLQGDWTNMSLTIEDPTQTDLPPGWIGFGDEDPDTFEPILPPGATFATVLASVDEFKITGAVPGFFFSSAGYDMRVDNIGIVTSGGNDCPTDLDGSGGTDFNDLVTLLASWGACPGCPADIDGNGEVGFDDLVTLLAAWGPCP